MIALILASGLAGVPLEIQPCAQAVRDGSASAAGLCAVPADMGAVRSPLPDDCAAILTSGPVAARVIAGADRPMAQTVLAGFDRQVEACRTAAAHAPPPPIVAAQGAD